MGAELSAGQRLGVTVIVRVLRMQTFNRGPHPRRNRLCIPHSQSSGRNRLSYPHLQRTALDMVSIHREQIERPDQRNWHDVCLRLDGEKECARQERKNLAIRTAATFRENY